MRVLNLSFFDVSPKQETTTPRRRYFRSGGGLEHVHESTSEDEPAHRTLSRVRRALGLESERGDVREASSRTGKTKPETVGRFQIKIQPKCEFRPDYG